MALFFQIPLVFFSWLSYCTQWKSRLGGVTDRSTMSAKRKPCWSFGGGTHYAACCTPSSCNCRVQLSRYVFLGLLRVDAGIYLHLKESEFIAARIATITTETLCWPTISSIFQWSIHFDPVLISFKSALFKQYRQHWFSSSEVGSGFSMQAISVLNWAFWPDFKFNNQLPKILINPRFCASVFLFNWTRVSLNIASKHSSWLAITTSGGHVNDWGAGKTRTRS